MRKTSDNNDPDGLRSLLLEPTGYTEKYITYGLIGMGHLLRVALDDDPSQFADACDLVGVSEASGQAMAMIERRLFRHSSDADRLHKIRWIKLAIIAERATAENREELMQLAERLTAAELELAIAHLPVTPDGCTMLFYFTAEQFDFVEQALLANGATRSGKALDGIEAALIKALCGTKV